MIKVMLITAVTAVFWAGGAGTAALTPDGQKAEIVSVSGCLKEPAPNRWVLVNATDPVPSANGSVTVSLQNAPAVGKNRFGLIGVVAFRLSTRKDQTVVVQGLLIKGVPESRLNVTSVASVSKTCAGAPK